MYLQVYPARFSVFLLIFIINSFKTLPLDESAPFHV